MVQLSAWQDYMTNKLYIQQISILLTVINNIWILPRKTGIVILTLQPSKTSFTPRHTIIGKGIAYVKQLDQNLPLKPIEIELENNHCCMEVHNTSDSTVEFLHGQEMAYFDTRSKGLVQINNLKHFPIDQYLHDRMTPATLSPSPLAYEKPIHPTEMPCITTRTELPIDDTNKSTPDDKYPWLDPDDIRRNMTDKEILRMKLNLKDSILNEKEKEEFLMKVEQFTDVFSLRDEISTCPFIEVHLKLKDETPFFVRPYPMREEQKKVIQKEVDRLKHLGIIHKGLTSYSSPVVLVKRKNQNLYQVCSDFSMLNEKLVKINHAFPLVRDCIEQLGRKKCHYLSTINLRDAFHTLRLVLSSQKYCGITPYYGSPTYHYLHMGMGMSVSPQIWQQFVDLVFQDDLIKCKQNFDVIMDDMFIHSTAEEHMDDLIDLFKVLRKYGLKLSPHKCQFFKAINYIVINHFLFRIDTQKDKDLDKGSSFLLVILEKYEPIIFNTYHNSLLAGHQGPYHTAMTIRQKFFIHNLMNKVKRYIEACHTCLKTKPKYMKNRPIYGRIPVDYAPMQDLSIDIKMMPQAFGRYHLLLVITCDQTNFMIAVPLRDRTAQTIAEALIYRVIYLFGPPRQIISDEATEFTSAIIQAILCMLNCRLKVISPYNHGSSKCKRQI